MRGTIWQGCRLGGGTLLIEPPRIRTDRVQRIAGWPAGPYKFDSGIILLPKYLPSGIPTQSNPCPFTRAPLPRYGPRTNYLSLRFDPTALPLQPLHVSTFLKRLLRAPSGSPQSYPKNLVYAECSQNHECTTIRRKRIRTNRFGRYCRRISYFTRISYSPKLYVFGSVSLRK